MVTLGFKESDVGTIPEDWEVACIGDFDPFVTSGSRGWAEFYAEFGDPFVRITNQTRDRIYLDLDDLRFVRLPADSAEGKRTSLKNDDILISITADIGICSFVDDSLAKPAYINQHIAMVRFSTDQIVPQYVNYFLASDPVQRMFVASSDTGAKAGMNLDGIRAMKFAKPEPAEQEAISKALSDVDGLIAGLEALIAKKRDLKTATMQQLLSGKTRLPGFGEGVGMKQSELGQIPEDWTVEKLGDLAVFANGKPLEPLIDQNGAYELITLDSIGIDGTLKSSGKRTNLFNDSLRPGDIVAVLSDLAHGYLLGLCDVLDDTETYVLNQRMARLRANEGNSPEFIRLQINRRQSYFRERGQGTSQRHIYKRDFDELRIPVPKMSEQKAIAEVVTDTDLSITALVEQLGKAKALKQGMMQELLTGRTRLI